MNSGVSNLAKLPRVSTLNLIPRYTKDGGTFMANLLDKDQLYVNLSEIDVEDDAVSEDDKVLNEQFYGG